MWLLVTLVAQVAAHSWSAGVRRCVAAAVAGGRCALRGARARVVRPLLLLLEPPARGSQTHRRCVSRRGPPLAA